MSNAFQTIKQQVVLFYDFPQMLCCKYVVLFGFGFVILIIFKMKNRVKHLHQMVRWYQGETLPQQLVIEGLVIIHFHHRVLRSSTF